MLHPFVLKTIKEGSLEDITKLDTLSSTPMSKDDYCCIRITNLEDADKAMTLLKDNNIKADRFNSASDLLITGITEVHIRERLMIANPNIENVDIWVNELKGPILREVADYSCYPGIIDPDDDVKFAVNRYMHRMGPEPNYNKLVEAIVEDVYPSVGNYIFRTGDTKYTGEMKDE